MAQFDEAIFRAQCPEFADTTQYPTILIGMYWEMATSFIANDDSPCNMLSGQSLALALNWMTAHLMKITGAGTDPNGAANESEGGGFTTSASVGEVSVSKLAPPAKDAWSWWLNGSVYGQTLLALLSVKAVGGISVGGLPEREAFRKVGGLFL